MTIRNEAIEAKEENHFSPLMTHSSPSCTAEVVKTLGSAPPWGSVMEKQDTISLASSGSRYRCFSSGVP